MQFLCEAFYLESLLLKCNMDTPGGTAGTQSRFQSVEGVLQVTVVMVADHLLFEPC